MPTSNLALAKLAARTSPATWDAQDMFARDIVFRDTVNVLTADVARAAASGGVAIATTGAATFQLTQAGILTAGDYFNVARGGTNYKFTVVSGATTSFAVTPPPAVAFGVGNVTIVDDGATSTSTFVTAPGLAVGDKFFTTTGGIEYTVTAVLSATTFTTTPDTAAAAQAWANSYVPVNVGSYVDFPSFAMPGIAPIPEQFRMRFGGTGTLSGTYQVVRVDALTGVETAVTTAVATTAAAVWQGVAAVATAQAEYGASVANGAIDEFLRLVLTAKTTTTTGRTILPEFQHLKATPGN